MMKLSEGFLAGFTDENAAKKGIELKIGIADSVSVLLCFAMGYCSIFSGMTPLGPAAYAAVFSAGRWYLYLAAAALGIIRAKTDLSALVYLASMAVSTLFMGFLKSGARTLTRAVISAVSLFTALTVSNIITGFYMFDALSAFAESAICFGAVFMFITALPVILNGNERRYISDVEAISVICVFALLVRCMASLPLVFGINPSVVCAIVLLMVINLEGEIASGAAMGVILGIVAVTDTQSMCSSVGAFAIASLCSGVLKKFGKWGIIFGFTFANALFAAFFREEILPFDIFEVVCASVIFAVLPQKITSYISSFPAKTVHTSADTNVTHDKLQTMISDRLKRLSCSFSSLASSYERCFENRTMSKQYIIRMLDTASSKICPDCGLKYSCWERGYKASYAAMLDMLKKAEEKGSLSVSDIPEPFSSKCIKSDGFVKSFNRMFEVYRVEKLWQKRLNESRALVSNQLRGIGFAIDRLGAEFSMCVDVPAEKQLKTALDREGIRCDDIAFFNGSGTDFSADIYFKNSRISKKDEQTINAVVAELTGKTTYLARSQYVNSCLVLTFKPCLDFCISTAVAAVCRSGEEVSGDSHVICENACGETVCAISDGMGTGVSASRESLAATELLRDFLSSGIDVETSLELINSSLLLRSSGDSFATMDVCTARLSDGVLSFSKSGAAPSYIRNEYGISKIESDSLPFGVLETDSNIKTELFAVENSAVVLMMSDGVYDVFDHEKEDGIMKKFESLETVNPQIIASVMLNTALELSGGKADDDMTVLALSVWKN